MKGREDFFRDAGALVRRNELASWGVPLLLALAAVLLLSEHVWPSVLLAILAILAERVRRLYTKRKLHQLETLRASVAVVKTLTIPGYLALIVRKGGGRYIHKVVRISNLEDPEDALEAMTEGYYVVLKCEVSTEDFALFSLAGAEILSENMAKAVGEEPVAIPEELLGELEEMEFLATQTPKGYA